MTAKTKRNLLIVLAGVLLALGAVGLVLSKGCTAQQAQAVDRGLVASLAVLDIAKASYEARLAEAVANGDTVTAAKLRAELAKLAQTRALVEAGRAVIDAALLPGTGAVAKAGVGEVSTPRAVGAWADAAASLR